MPFIGQSGFMTISSELEFIGEECFRKELENISFESGSHLLLIDKEAFRESSLRSIVIPVNVEYIGEYCFEKCKSLENVSFEDSTHLVRIGKRAFSLF